jgi:glutamate dehydrogenase
MIDALDARIPGALQLDLYGAVQQFTLDRMAWFMRHVDFSAGLEALVKRFAVSGTEGDASAWTARGVPADLARRMAGLLAAAGRPDAVLAAEVAKVEPLVASAAIEAIARRLRVGEIKAMIAAIAPADSAERQALSRLTDGIDGSLRRLAVEALRAGGVDPWGKGRSGPIDRAVRTIVDMLVGAPGLAKATVAAAALGDLPSS